jgi:hypothetical protein
LIESIGGCTSQKSYYDLYLRIANQLKIQSMVKTFAKSFFYSSSDDEDEIDFWPEKNRGPRFAIKHCNILKKSINQFVIQPINQKQNEQ